jgi:hypothetical protein
MMRGLFATYHQGVVAITGRVGVQAPDGDRPVPTRESLDFLHALRDSDILNVRLPGGQNFTIAAEGAGDAIRVFLRQCVRRTIAT